MSYALEVLRQRLDEYNTADNAVHAVLMADQFDNDAYKRHEGERSVAARLLSFAANLVLGEQPPAAPKVIEDADEIEPWADDASNYDDQDYEPYPEEDDARWGYAL